MIQSFRDPDAERLSEDLFSRRLQSVERTARRKLAQLDQAKSLRDLTLPGNQLEALKGDRTGQYSMRINDQYRLCFRWMDGDAYDVEITDYH